MSFELLARKLALDKERFVSSEKIKDYCGKLGISYISAIKYLGKYNYIKRILRGFFYVPTIEERKLNTGWPSLSEAIARAMEYKKVKNWYFGLESAIKFNSITHEFFTIDYVVSDTIFRSKSITILDRKVKFVKLSKNLFGFGIKKSGYANYSDLEKTLLDFIHLKKYKGKSDKVILDELIEWTDNVDKNKLKKYAVHYNYTVMRIAEGLK
jgi:hypothetical protein